MYMDDSSSDSDKVLEVQGRNMIWFTDCKFILKYDCHLLAALQAANLAVAFAPLTNILHNKKWQKRLFFDKFYDRLMLPMTKFYFNLIQSVFFYWSALKNDEV